MSATRKKQLQALDDLEAIIGRDRSEVLYTLPDGWTVRRLTCLGDLEREGILMSNCWRKAYWDERDRRIAHPNDYAPWRDFTGDWTSPIVSARGEYWSLRDPDNIPHVSFFHKDNYNHSFNGKHNGHVAIEYMTRLNTAFEAMGTR